MLRGSYSLGIHIGGCLLLGFIATFSVRMEGDLELGFELVVEVGQLVLLLFFATKRLTFVTTVTVLLLYVQ